MFCLAVRRLRDQYGLLILRKTVFSRLAPQTRPPTSNKSLSEAPLPLTPLAPFRGSSTSRPACRSTSRSVSTREGLVSSARLIRYVYVGVTLNGQVNQVTIHGLVVQESGDNTCLATGPGAHLCLRNYRDARAHHLSSAGQNTQSIISYASTLNSSYTWQPQVSLVLGSLNCCSPLRARRPSATATSSGGKGTNVGGENL